MCSPSPPYFCQELFRASGKIQVIGAEVTMKKFLIIWEVGYMYVLRDVFLRASNVGLRTCRENWNGGRD